MRPHEKTDPLGLGILDDLYGWTKEKSAQVIDWAQRKLGLTGGTRLPSQSTIEDVQGMPGSEITERFSGQTPGGFGNAFRRETTDIGSTIVAAGAVAGREVVVYYVGGKATEMVAMAGGRIYRTFTTVEEAQAFAQAEGTAIRWERVEQAGQEARYAGVEGNGAAKVATTGQEHHAVSRRVQRALEEHPVLSGQYKPRDPRFVTDARDLASHRGYQLWHRELDAEVGAWIRSHPNASKEEFETYIRGVYDRPDIKVRFPNGLSSGQ
jgi:hypothetical protein